MMNIVECPLGCGWTLDITPPQVPPATLAVVFGPGVFTAAAAIGHAVGVERLLREHFSSHPLEEWVTEIVRLSATLAEVRERAMDWTRWHESRPKDERTVVTAQAAECGRAVLAIIDQASEAERAP